MVISAEASTVIRIVSKEGTGRESDPVRNVVSWWTMDGKLIGREDPIDENPTAPLHP